MARKRVKDLGMGEEEESRYVSRLSREIEANGALDKIAVGERTDAEIWLIRFLTFVTCRLLRTLRYPSKIRRELLTVSQSK